MGELMLQEGKGPAVRRPGIKDDAVAPRGVMSALRRAFLVSVALLLVVVTVEMAGYGSGALNRLGDVGRPVWLLPKADQVFQSRANMLAHQPGLPSGGGGVAWKSGVGAAAAIASPASSLRVPL